VKPGQVSGLGLVAELVRANDKSLILKDGDGNYHFAGGLRNVKDVTRALNALPAQFADLVKQDARKIKDLFEEVFRHSEFTGRSGTFFAYEGLGSIYWHMVSKLLLAVQETILRTRDESSTAALMEKYADIRKGLSFNKSPGVYGAFPTDPYSHTPKGQGAKQPGMTGMVKEEILTRQMELGCSIENGNIKFDFLLFDDHEYPPAPSTFAYWNVNGQRETITCPAGSVAYSVCQIPVIVRASDKSAIEIHFSDGSLRQIAGHVLDETASSQIFKRDGHIHHLVVTVAS
jgi:hypothetical protein